MKVFVASFAYKIKGVREFLFKTVSQITLHYRNSTLSQGKVGDVHGGDRLPWTGSQGFDNYTSSNSIGWQVHVYGEASSALRTWCEQHHIILHIVEWKPGYKKVGFTRNAMYLLRPDMYVALAATQSSPDALERYFCSQGYTWDGLGKT